MNINKDYNILIIDDDSLTRTGLFEVLTTDYNNSKIEDKYEFPYALVGTSGNSFKFFYCEDPEKLESRIRTFLNNHLFFDQIYFDMKFDNYGDGDQSNIFETKGYDLLKNISKIYRENRAIYDTPKLFIYSILQPSVDDKIEIKKQLNNYNIYFIEDKTVEGLLSSVNQHSDKMLEKLLK
ncbi:MAG: hypothetical protein Q7S59_02105 [Sulfurimonas sp.]|nr:hypothetical protein [Sulfurimonas sp.]